MSASRGSRFFSSEGNRRRRLPRRRLPLQSLGPAARGALVHGRGSGEVASGQAGYGGSEDIGRGARLNRVIIDSGVRIPEGLVVGEDPALDAKRFRVSEKGICLITQDMINKLST